MLFHQVKMHSQFVLADRLLVKVDTRHGMDDKGIMVRIRDCERVQLITAA